MQKVLLAEDDMLCSGHAACPGCIDALSVRHVLAALGPKTMAIVTDKNDAATAPATFVRNQLEIATLPGNPDKVDSLKDLTKSGLKVVLCDKTVPCGAAARHSGWAGS